MSDRPDDLEDDLLRARLKSALGTTPSRLTSRLEHLSSAGLDSGELGLRSRARWLELAPTLAGAALVVALLAGLVPRLVAWIGSPSKLDAALSAVRPLGSPGAWNSLMLPIGVLLCVEAMRGAPTVRRWMR